MPGPKFGILTATHEDTYQYLPFCIESIRTQARYEPDDYTYQHIIVDDGSERTREYLDAEAERDPHIVPIHLEENRGQVVALKAGELALINASVEIFRTQGISVAETLPNYFLVVDADDGLTPTALLDYSQTALKQWRESRTIPGVMFGYAAIIDEHGHPLDDVPHMPGYNNIPDTTDIDSFLGQMKVCNHLPSKAAFQREFFHLGGIPNTVNNERVRCVDWLLALSGLRQCRKPSPMISGYVHMPVETSYYRVHPMQSSLSGSTNGRWERERLELVEGHFNPLVPKGPLTLEELKMLGWIPSRTAFSEMAAIQP